MFLTSSLRQSINRISGALSSALILVSAAPLQSLAQIPNAKQDPSTTNGTTAPAARLDAADAGQFQYRAQIPAWRAVPEQCPAHPGKALRPVFVRRLVRVASNLSGLGENSAETNAAQPAGVIKNLNNQGISAGPRAIPSKNSAVRAQYRQRDQTAGLVTAQLMILMLPKFLVVTNRSSSKNQNWKRSLASTNISVRMLWTVKSLTASLFQMF